VRKLFVVLVVILLVACGEGVQRDNAPPDPTRHKVNGWTTVQEVILTDGTLCAVVVVSSDGVDIECNWRNG
jgi:hypothetical protein